jgi:macrolide transport system ATP-binding/permease protein
MWWTRKQQDFNAEIEAHLQLEADRLREDGLTPEDARAKALKTFGNRTLAEERFYESRRWILLDNLLRDVRFAARVLRKDARFTLLAILGLALGIGLSTAIFALINTAIGLSSAVGETDPGFFGIARIEKAHPRADVGLSYPVYLYFRSRATAFRAIKAESGRFLLMMGGSVVAGRPTEAEPVSGRFESANFLSAVGLQPALGRLFSTEEEQIGGPAVAVVSFRFWRMHFGSDPGVLGKTVILNAHSLTIIGVADPKFGGVGDPSHFYLPLVLAPAMYPQNDWMRDLNEHWLMVDAWLRPGVAGQQAQAEIDVLSSALQRKDESFQALRGGPNRSKVAEIALVMAAVIVAVSMILLIACSNLANLLLARAVVRRREIGVRLSLGASRARLVCQLLTESMLLSIAGGALGLLFSYWLAKALVRGAPVEVHLDYRVILYVLVLVLATGFSIGLAPALAATKTNLAQALHADGLSAVRSPSNKIWSARNGLVVVPLTVSLMMLLGAGMTIHLIRTIYLNAPSFDASRLISMSFHLNLQGYDEMRTRQFQENLRERTAKIPGVASVALATTAPLADSYGWFPLLTEGSAILSDDASPHADYDVVSPEFFKTVGTPVFRGRVFNVADREGGPPVAMVNQELARRYWKDENPIGKRIRLGNTSTTFFEVVGVAPDFEDATSPLSTVRPMVYVPYAQAKVFFNGVKIATPVYQTQVVVRANGDAAAVKGLLRQDVASADPSLRLDFQTIQEITESRHRDMKTIMWLLSALGALAMVMASIGIYAALAYAISQRTREIGIRMALGAQRREILALVMGRTMVLVFWSIGFGLLGALALNRIFSRSLRKVGELDAVTCISVAILLGVVALAASYFPARKALRVDPVQALRCE